MRLIRLLLSGEADLVIRGSKKCKLVLLAAAAVLAALDPLFRVFHCFVQFRIAREYIITSSANLTASFHTISAQNE